MEHKQEGCGHGLVLIDKEDNFARMGVEQIHSNELNKWHGWHCSAGLRNLYIDYDGNVFRGVCRVGGWIGCIYTTTGLTNVTPLRENKWITCTKEMCSCGADMAVPKSKDETLAVKFFTKSAKISSEFKLNNTVDTLSPIAVYDHSLEDFRLVTWEIGRRCNFDCWYCSENSHNNFAAQTNLATLESAYLRINNWARNERIKFNFTGGEPTVYSDYLPFVKILKSYDHIIMTTTNGSHSVNYYSELAEFSDICFSIHLEYVKKFGKEKFLKSIRAAVETRNKAKAAGTSARFNWIGVRIMLDPGNQSIAEEFYNECKEMFHDIDVNIDTVHDTTDGHKLFEYKPEEIIWVTKANK